MLNPAACRSEAVMLLTFFVLSLMARPYEDRTFQSRVFAQERHYRLFLPPDYQASDRRYPVIYYFH